MFKNIWIAKVARQIYLIFYGYEKDYVKISVYKSDDTLTDIIALATAPRNPEDENANNYKIWWTKP